MKRLSLIHAQGDADNILRVGKQLRNGPAEQQGDHGTGTAVVIQIEFHEFGFGDGNAVYGMTVILLKTGRGDEIQRIGHLLIPPGGRKIGPACHRVGPLLRGDLVPDQTDSRRLQLNVISLRAIVIEKGSQHLIRACPIRHTVEHIQNDPVIPPAKRDHVEIGCF